MSYHNFDYLFKFVLLGKYGSGKSSLLSRYTDDYFQQNKSTIGLEFKIKMIIIENKLIKLQIWGITPGCARFCQTPIEYEYKGAHGFIFIYDITDIESFKYIKEKINRIKTIEQKTQTNICKVLVGNKCDKLERSVSEEDGRQLANENSMGFFETSSKDNKNVNEVFEYLIRKILDIVHQDQSYNKGFLLNKNNAKKDKDKECYN